jgi:hypothetical protein
MDEESFHGLHMHIWHISLYIHQHRNESILFVFAHSFKHLFLHDDAGEVSDFWRRRWGAEETQKDVKMKWKDSAPGSDLVAWRNLLPVPLFRHCHRPPPPPPPPPKVVTPLSPRSRI